MLIPLTLVDDQPLQKQLYEQVLDLIVSARLPPGTRMPSTRTMAERFGISRTTVLLTYERLIANGYLETSRARGTYVRRRVKPRVDAAVGAKPSPGDSMRPAQPPSHEQMGAPDPSLFPVARWKTLMRGTLDRLGLEVRSAASTTGRGLRNAIAGWLATSRGLDVDPKQVVVVHGRRQALHLVVHMTAHLRTQRNVRAVVEDPGDSAFAGMLAHASAEIIRVPVDADGICADRLPRGKITLLRVTPEHQRPLGATLSLARRHALLAWAARAGALILEEDIDGEVRYGRISHPSLMKLDSDDLVIMLGGFDTSLGPWLSLAFLVFPRRMTDVATQARRLLDDIRFSLEETALAEFLDSGSYARHLLCVGKEYGRRRDMVVDLLRNCFGQQTAIWGGKAGLHLTWFPSGMAGPAAYLAELARRCGLECAAVAGRSTPPLPTGVCLGFGSLSAPQLEARLTDFAGCVSADTPKTSLFGG